MTDRSVNFAKSWLKADDKGTDSDDLLTEARWEFERVVNEAKVLKHLRKVTKAHPVMFEVLHTCYLDGEPAPIEVYLGLTVEDVATAYYDLVRPAEGKVELRLLRLAEERDAA